MQYRILLFLCLAGSMLALSSLKAPQAGEMQWMSLAEAEAAMHKEPRPLLIDLYTDWCGWCKVMDKKTYSNPQVENYVREKFYAVKINAETREGLVWQGRTYGFNPQYKTNDFAIYLTGGRLEFPTTVIIPTDGSGPQAIPGFLEPKDFEMIAKYFGEGLYGRTPFRQYSKEFKPSW